MSAPDAITRKLFVTAALPYANGPFHIGHVMEYIQADIWVRFQRMQGHQVRFVGADDAHGAPIMIAAEKAGMTPQAFVASIAAGRQQYFDGLHISFDNWSSTDGSENHALLQKDRSSNRIQVHDSLHGRPLHGRRRTQVYGSPAKSPLRQCRLSCLGSSECNSRAIWKARNAWI